VRATAEALAGQGTNAAAINQNLDYARANSGAALQVAQACAALGAQEATFELLNGYYFGQGAWSGLQPKGGDEDRITKALFQPMMSQIWPTSEFGQLVQRIGLEA
jgi:hypothetical protein